MLRSKQDRAIKIATRLVKSNTLATEFAERLTRCKHESYLGLHIFVEDLNEFSTYFVVAGHYESLMTSDTAEKVEIAWWAAKRWVRDFHSYGDEEE